MTDSPAYTVQEVVNKRAVLAFYDAALNQKNVDAAMAYVGDTYTQHNPNASDGTDGFRAFVASLRQTSSQSHSQILRTFVDGDFVILHVHKVVDPGTLGNAIIDIFRLEGGKIVEHWDVTQAVPARTASGNPMF